MIISYFTTPEFIFSELVKLEDADITKDRILNLKEGLKYRENAYKLIKILKEKYLDKEIKIIQGFIANSLIEEDDKEDFKDFSEFKKIIISIENKEIIVSI